MSYAVCQDAYDDGVYNIPQVHPSYADDLDSDSDGVACEVHIAGGRDLSGYSPTVTTSATATVTQSPTALPVTGQSNGYPLVLSALILLAVGVCALVTLYVFKPRPRRH